MKNGINASDERTIVRQQRMRAQLSAKSCILKYLMKVEKSSQVIERKRFVREELNCWICYEKENRYTKYDTNVLKNRSSEVLETTSFGRISEIY